MQGSTDQARKPEPESEFGKHIASADLLIGALRGLNDGFDAMANRALGARPVEKDPAQPQAVPNGLTEELRDRHQTLSALLADLSRHFTRISTIA